MPRKRRIEFPGAVYHIIGRGNYRKDLFRVRGSGERFVETLFEAVERCGWRVFAYVVMSNHFHVAMQTPEPNLVTGMQWLQGTFATRFNRFHNERGHVFQGRYKAILVEEDRPLLGLIDYIHLNPVRARICDLEALKTFKLSSYPDFLRRRVRVGLDRRTLLSLLGVADGVAGMRRYNAHLQLSEAVDPKKRNELSRKYCRGWFIGSEKEKNKLAKNLAALNPATDWELADYKELNEARWEQIVEMELRKREKSEEGLLIDLKGMRYKAEIALRLRRETTAGNLWIAQRLNMGHPSRVTNLIREYCQ